MKRNDMTAGRILVAVIALTASLATVEAKMKALIVDGQNNHAVWPKSTIMMKQYLEDTGLFVVEVARTRYTWKADREMKYLPLAKAGTTEDLKEPKPDPNFSPSFGDYDVVISNFGNNAADWPEETQAAFEAYVRNGGGFVSVHAANNSFGQWNEYNRIIGIGGWGGRKSDTGIYVYYSKDGKLTRDDSPGKVGAHGPRHEFPITIREPNHPITKGMPLNWMASKDECYATLRGPAENMTVLATGKDQSGEAPTDRHEPMLMVIDYGKGRVFHMTLGHDTDACEGVGYITCLTRGAEWAATGMVTQALPKDFPTEKTPTRRAFTLK